jgi:O-antigen ligase
MARKLLGQDKWLSLMGVFSNRAATHYIVGWSIVGFPLLALVTEALGQPSTTASIVFRALAAAAAVLLLIRYPPPNNRIAALLFLMFWSAYLVRLTITTIWDNQHLSQESSFYWVWSVGACFLPAMAIFLAYRYAKLSYLFPCLIVATAVAIILGLVTGDFTFARSDGTLTDINRLNVASLNPISMGHLGVTGVLLGLSAFMAPAPRPSIRAAAIILIAFGGLLTVLSNSRGPFVAVAFCVTVLFVTKPLDKRLVRFGIPLVALLFAAVIYQRDFIFSDAGFVARFTDVFEESDRSAFGRVVAYEGALNQFAENPLFGDSLEERRTRYYPHNIILEAFMATGLIGGLPFLALIFLAVARSWQLVRRRGPEIWIGLLTMQYIVAGMFSGAIFTSNTMWVLIALALSTEVARKVTAAAAGGPMMRREPNYLAAVARS